MKKVICIILSALMVLSIAPLSFAASPVKVRVDSTDLNLLGAFDGWGTSLCWWAETLGCETEAERMELSKAFFDPNEGLGLNIVRYNIGAGDDPSHNHLNNGHDMRGLPVWVDENGVFNPDADPNQIAILKDAVYYGANIVECFSNSPPYYLTVSGCSSGNKKSGENNILPENFDKFADYLAAVTAYIQNELGIKVDTLEPLNESVTDYWGYNGTQEGCHVDAKDHSALIVAVHKALQAHGLTDVGVAASDENNSDRMADYISDYTPEAISKLSRINTHSYQGGGSRIFNKALELGKKLYMTEVDWAASTGHDAGNMGPAMWLSNKISSDLKYMRPNAWVCWQITGPAPGGNSDSGYWYMSQYDLETNRLDLFKKYYAFAHFTKFIRPGDYILPTEYDNVTAARNLETGKAVVVITNAGRRDEKYEIDLSSFENLGSKVSVYRTDKDNDLVMLENGAVLNGKVLCADIPVNTITTIVVENENPAAVTNMGLTLTSNGKSCFVGDGISFNAKAYNQKDSITFSANGGEIDQNGSFTANRVGRAAVTATIDGTELSASLDVDVVQSGDTVRLVSAYSGLAVQEDADGLTQWGDNDSAYQYWRMDKINDIITFTNLRSGKLLSDADNTEWRLERHDGGYALINTGTGKALDVYGNSRDEGTKIGTYDFNGDKNQLWDFILGRLEPEIDILADNETDLRLIPTAINGTAPYGGSQEVTFDKAFDGDVRTHHDAWDGDNSYISADMPQDRPVTLISYYPREGFDWRMFGGKFYGVKDGEETLLYTVPKKLKNGWNNAYIKNDVIYDQIIYRTPKGGMCNIAELEFYSIPYTAHMSCDNSALTIDVESYTQSSDLRAVVIYQNKGSFPHADILSVPLERFERKTISGELNRNFEKAYVYLMDAEGIITSGYIHLEQIN